MAIKIGTRGSKLALWQANHVMGLLGSAGWESEIQTIQTTGDRVQDVPLSQMGLVGIFTKALDEALLERRVDIAVHSCKDLPSILADGLEIAALLKREDPRDVLLATNPQVNLENFSQKLVIGTSSVRRRALLKYHFDHLEIKDIRGNVDTRIQKMESGEYDGIMLAYAGVKRMGLTQYIVQKMNPDSFTSAIGQGAIAVVCRSDFEQKEELRQLLNHLSTEQAVKCERAFLRTIEGGCHTPAFGLATVVADQLSFTAGLAEEEGKYIHKLTIQGAAESCEQLGIEAAQDVLAKVN
ncbi:hydroxymethylbilane synthase [Pontibacter sp. G13]|uniref:hydroxymethylbilane synthase n=1 Tax=Pontibacter sp. G13 TaxID=3074898 RepID=UPI002889D11A|nr:hydroxymethylbilane synthase [Pontibacter sp. G13]WNJ16238.1 hydroxymethylbilane synthase [Pontibacter sp. G13]